MTDIRGLVERLDVDQKLGQIQGVVPWDLVDTESLFDGTLQGIERTDKVAFSFQGHPEASPGPHDVAPLFDKFIQAMAARR